MTSLVVLFFFNKEFGTRFRFLKRLIPFEKLHSFSAEFYQAVHNYQHHRKELVSAILVSSAGQIIAIYIIASLAKVITLEIPVSIFYILFPLINFAMLTPSINGLGAREALFVFYLAPYCDPESALVISLLMDSLLISLGVIGGIVVAFKGKIALKDAKNFEEKIHGG